MKKRFLFKVSILAVVFEAVDYAAVLHILRFSLYWQSLDILDHNNFQYIVTSFHNCECPCIIRRVLFCFQIRYKVICIHFHTLRYDDFYIFFK